MEQKAWNNEFKFSIEKTVTSMPELSNDVAIYEYCNVSGTKKENLLKKLFKNKKTLVLAVCVAVFIIVAAIAVLALCCKKTSSDVQDGEMTFFETTVTTEPAESSDDNENPTKPGNPTKPTKDDSLQQVESNEKDELSIV